MKKRFRLLAVLMAVFMAVSILPVSAFAAGTGDTRTVSAEPAGEGTQAEPYQISSAEELIWFAEEVNGSAAKSTSELCAVLTQNIDLKGQEWTPIGKYNGYSDYVYYGGVFDGNGKTVSGLAIDSTKQYQALFGYVKGGTIKNLTVSGSVATSAASSPYAAGIVGYGSPVTVENCTNNVTVTATAKGYAAGIAGYASSGSRIANCTNNGAISGAGDYVGGIVATAMKTTIQNCFNHGSITDTGKPGSYSYSVGGIAGSASSASVISMCGNTGEISSTIKRTGGIVGSLDGSVEKSFNTGNVTGIYGVGGIAGDSAGKASAITSCYNLGNVTAKAPTVSFSDTNAKGVGGIIGGVGSYSNKAAIENCYNAGRVTLEDGVVSDVTAGGVVGNSSGKNYSGIETTGLVTAANSYYLDTAASQGDGYTASASGMTVKTEAQMKASDFAASLGGDYIAGKDGGYPVLGWQDPDALYKVQFTIEPAGAVLVVKDENGQKTEPSEGTVYELKNGTYFYEVTGEECEPAAGSFTVAYGGQDLSVSLNVKKYDFKFTTDPAEAELSVEGQTPLADGRTYQLAKAGNPYRYTVKAFGYEPVAGTVQVTGNADADKLNVTLTKQAVRQVSFPVTKEAGGMESDVLITVRSSAYPSAEILPQADGSFALPDGDYTYKISSTGYKSAGGSFTVSGADLVLPETYLEIQRAWDGTTLEEPAKDADGVYQITTPNELMWFNQNAALTDSAKLLADIRVNEDMTADASSFYKWAPIGTASSKAYTGSFDGNGHTISGLYVSTTANYTGMFGYVGAGGSISNLTLSDSSINCTQKYVGAIVGDLKGTIEKCHTTDNVSVTGLAYVGGIVGELDGGGSVNGCSNAGTVTGTGTTTSNGYVGGIAGRVYSALSTALTDSYNSGAVSGSSFVGGVAGTHYYGGTIKNVYNTGNVTAVYATGTAGGITGQLRMGSIVNAYNSGSVSASAAGAVIGSLDFQTGSKTLEQVYYLNGIADSAIGDTKGYTVQTGTAQGCTAEELQNLAGVLGDGFADDDASVNGGYPLLNWQAGGSTDDPNAPVPDPEGWDGKTAAQAPEQINGV